MSNKFENIFYADYTIFISISDDIFNLELVANYTLINTSNGFVL